MKKQTKNQKTFQLNVKGYSLLIIRDSGDSNYNTFTHVLRGKEKTPLFGTSFNDNTTDGTMLDWANKRLEKHLSGEDAQKDKELLSMFKDMI